MDSTYTSLSALRASGQSLANTAHNIANSLTPGFSPGRIGFSGRGGSGVMAVLEPSTGQGRGGVDLAQEMTRLTLDEHCWAANIQALRVQEESRGLIIDLMG